VPTTAHRAALPTVPPTRPARWRAWRILLLLGLAIAGGLGGDSVARVRPQLAFFGLDVPNANLKTQAALASRLGAVPTVTSVFVKLDSVSVSRVLNAIPSEMTPFVTLEPWSRTSRWNDKAQLKYSLTSITDGAHDAELKTLAHQLAGFHRTVYLRFAHEMNGSWYPWAEAVNGNNPGDYRRAWRHVHDLLEPIAGKRVKWVWSPNIVGGVPASSPSLSELYPGDAYVDYVGVTGYSHGQSVRNTFCPTVSQLDRLTSKPIVLSEIGADGSNKVEWLRELGPFLQANSRIAGFVYFNTSPQTTGATGNYRIDQRLEDLVALRASLAQLGLVAPGSTPAANGSDSVPAAQQLTQRC
jgi:mannan endo-1,4-beta-mannosidase